MSMSSRQAGGRARRHVPVKLRKEMPWKKNQSWRRDSDDLCCYFLILLEVDNSEAPHNDKEVGGCISHCRHRTPGYFIGATPTS